MFHTLLMHKAQGEFYTKSFLALVLWLLPIRCQSFHFGHQAGDQKVMDLETLWIFILKISNLLLQHSREMTEGTSCVFSHPTSSPHNALLQSNCNEDVHFLTTCNSISIHLSNSIIKEILYVDESFSIKWFNKTLKIITVATHTGTHRMRISVLKIPR